METLIFAEKPTGKRFMDITGRRFKKLLVLGYAGKEKNEMLRWHCRCDCGNVLIVRGGNLKSNLSTSCGCSKRGLGNENNKLLWKLIAPTKNIWDMMIRRCKNKMAHNYHNYGGRGITVCKRWEVFENFLADMGERPDGLSIDRIDNDGNYCPGNCRWATRMEQANNTRRNKVLAFNGQTKSIRQWADEFLINKDTLYYRIIIYGWPIEKALTTPILNRKCIK